MLKKRILSVLLTVVMLICGIPTSVFAAGESISGTYADQVTKTNAVVHATLNNPYNIQPTEVGCYIGTSAGNMRIGGRDTYVYNQTSLPIWYDVNGEMGMMLEAGTKYYFRFYAIVDGQTIYGDTGSFTTEQDVKSVPPTIGRETAKDITETNATLSAILFNPTGVTPSEVGCYIGKSQGSMSVGGRDTYVYNQTELDFWYDVNGDMGMTLEPGTKYYYRFYAVVNGETIYGKTGSFTTKSSVAADSKSPQDKPIKEPETPVKPDPTVPNVPNCANGHTWTSRTKDEGHPHNEYNVCGICGTKEKYGTYDDPNCMICHPSAGVAKANIKEGVYEIANMSNGYWLNAYSDYGNCGWKAGLTVYDGSAEQKFEIKSSGNGNYTIKTQSYGGRNLYVNGDVLVSGAAGNFCFVDRGNERYSISYADNIDMVLARKDAGILGGDFEVGLEKYTGAATQLWTLKWNGNLGTHAFPARTSAPAYGQGYYGAPYNYFPYERGNCTWYVYGRAYEILGYAPSFAGNAVNFANYRNDFKGYSTSRYSAKPGAVIVWQGNTYGHVAVVEAVHGDTITISESSYGGVWYNGYSDWGTRTINVNALDEYGLEFLCYIYLV